MGRGLNNEASLRVLATFLSVSAKSQITSELLSILAPLLAPESFSVKYGNYD